jgi:hypothetical protein
MRERISRLAMLRISPKYSCADTSSERFLRDAFSRMTEVSRGAINGARIGGAVNPQRARKLRLYFTPT